MTTFIHEILFFPFEQAVLSFTSFSWHVVSQSHTLRSWRSGFSWLIPKVPYLYSYSWNHVQLIGELGSLVGTIFRIFFWMDWNEQPFEGFDSKSELRTFCEESLFLLLCLINCRNKLQTCPAHHVFWWKDNLENDFQGKLASWHHDTTLDIQTKNPWGALFGPPKTHVKDLRCRRWRVAFERPLGAMGNEVEPN